MLFGPGPHRPLAVWRELNVLAIFLITAHITQQARLAGLNFSRPNLLLGLAQLACRIGHVAAFAHLRAPRIHQCLAVWSKVERENVLAIIAVVMSHLARLEI